VGFVGFYGLVFVVGSCFVRAFFAGVCFLGFFFGFLWALFVSLVFFLVHLGALSYTS
jgi:hypothetical protein